MAKTHGNVLSHAGAYLLARGLPGVIAFFAIPVFSRLLEPQEYGRFTLVLSTVVVLNALLFQWLRLSLVRYLPAYGEEPGRFKATLAALTLGLIAVLALAALSASLVPALSAWRSVIFAVWALLAIQATYEVCCEYARAAVKPWRYMSLQVIRSTVALALGAGLVMAGWGWWGPVAGLAAGMALGIASVVRGDWSDVRPAIDRAILSRVVQYGVPLSLTVALACVISSSDRFLIAWLRGHEAAGLYAVASDLIGQTLTLLMLVINLAMFPLAVRAWEQEGPDAAREQMRSNASLLLGLGVPCVVGLSTLAPGIAHSLLGESYRASAVSVIPLVAVGTFLACLKAYHFDAAFQFVHRTVVQVWIVLAAAVVNVALNLIAIPRWGIEGAAGASVVAFMVSIVLTIVIGRRYFMLPFPVRPALQVLLAATVMGAVLYPSRQNTAPAALAVQVVSGAAVYAAVLLTFDFLGARGVAMAWMRRLAPVSRHRAAAVPGMPDAGARVSAAGLAETR